MRIAIAGGSGFIGSALGRTLYADGHEVVWLRRPSSRTNAGPTIAWEPSAARIDARGLEGLDAVVNLGGVGIGDKKWTDDRKDAILESRIAATSLLASTVAALTDPPSVFVSASAIGYYGDRGDDELSEDCPPGRDFLASVCVQWEDAASPAARGGSRVVCLRSGIVLDPAGGALKRMLLPFKAGLGGRIGSGQQYMSWITLADEVAAIHRVITDPRLTGPVNLTAPNPVTNAEFTATLGTVLRRPTAVPTPLLPLRLRYGGELVQHLLLDSQRVVPAKLNAVGFDFAHPELEPALHAIVGVR